MAYESKYKKMTVKELKAAIREMTDILNEDISDLRMTGETMPKVFQKELKTLQEISTKGRGDTLGRGWGLNKAELTVYAEELQWAISWGTFTKEGREKQRDKVNKAYERFKKNHPGTTLTESQYESFGRMMGRLSDDILREMGSEQIVDLFEEARRKDVNINRTKLGRIIEEAYAERKEGATEEDIVDEIKKKMQSTLEERENRKSDTVRRSQSRKNTGRRSR